MDWNVPAGDQVGFDLDTAWFVPPGNQVGVNFAVASNTVSPAGWDSVLFGTTAVTQSTGQFITGAGAGDQARFGLQSVAGGPVVLATIGSFFGQFGSAALRLHTRYVLPTGFMAVRWGRPVVRNFHQDVRPSGFNAFAGFGAHWVSLHTRRIQQVGAGLQLQWGDAHLGGGVRAVDVGGRGIAAALYGRPVVSFRQRALRPSAFVATLYGQAMVDHHHDVEPAGWQSGVLGEPEVHAPREFIDLTNHGIAGPLWGDHHADNYTRYVLPSGFTGYQTTEHERFGRPEAQLWTRYIVQLHETTPDDGGVFGPWTAVHNRNLTIGAEGFDMARTGVPVVSNNARIIHTPPHQDFSVFGQALVAYRIRSVYPKGADTSWISHWTAVANTARVLAPQGWASAAVGRPERVWGNLQRLQAVGGTDTHVFGAAMVADAIRTVAPQPAQRGERVGASTLVQNRERYITPAGLDAGRLGVPTLEEHFTVIGAWPVMPPANQVGDGGRVRNLTPELAAYGATHTEWGRTQVFNQWERYAFQGFRSTMFGRHVVRDRRLFIEPPGIVALRFPVLHEVRNVDPDPPGAVTISPRSGVVSSRFGSPRVTVNSIYPEDFTSSEFGVASVIYMGISPKSVLPPYDEDAGGQFGIPSIPSPQWVIQQDDRDGQPWTH